MTCKYVFKIKSHMSVKVLIIEEEKYYPYKNNFQDIFIL